MSQGIRRTCGRCYETKQYDAQIQRCNKCGWTPHGSSLTMFLAGVHDKGNTSDFITDCTTENLERLEIERSFDEWKRKKETD